MSAIGLLELVVPASAIDLNGHVNNVQYVQWMQDAAIAHSASLGWPTERFLALGHTWVIHSHAITYLHSAFAGDRIQVYTWVASFQKIRSLRKYKFLRPTDKTVLATAETVFIFCAIDSRRPVAIPPEVRSAYPLPDTEP
ncbi:MAG: acyl-CoA thioesterase [Desulfobulbus sp.]|jgi:acyl-CoA thioester hydrolase